MEESELLIWKQPSRNNLNLSWRHEEKLHSVNFYETKDKPFSKLPKAEAHGLSPFQNQRRHCHLILGHRRLTEEPVYWDSPPGNLNRIRMGIRIDSLQKGFDGHGQTRFPVSVHNQTAFFATEQRVVLRMSILRDCTATRTPFGRVIGIQPVQRNIIVKTSRLENSSEKIQGDRQHLHVELSPLGLKPAQLLDGDVSIELSRQENYFSDHLPDVGIDEIPLAVAHLLELLQCPKRLEHRPAFGEMDLLRPDLLTEIALVQYLTFGSQRGVSEILVVDVDPDHITPPWQLFLFGKIRADFERWSQSKRLANPSVLDQRSESDKIQIPLDGHCDPVSWIQSKLDEEEFLGFECLAVAWNIKLDGRPIDSLACLLLSPDGASNVTYHLTVEATPPLCFQSDSFPEFVELGKLCALREKIVALNCSLFLKLGEAIPFEFGSYYLEENRPFHPKPRGSSLLTCLKTWVSAQSGF
jgi:hypothetical protein